MRWLAGFLLAAIFPFIASPQVSIWRSVPVDQLTCTGPNGTACESQSFTTFSAPVNSNLIQVQPALVHQNIEGFGAALTDSSAYLLNGVLSSADRDAVLTKLFSPSNGIGLNFVRVIIGGSDFVLDDNYTYDDAVDPTLANFRIDTPRSINVPNYSPGGIYAPASNVYAPQGDKSHILPVLAKVFAVSGANSRLKVFANPHSAPAWMKTNAALSNSGKLGCLEGYSHGACGGSTTDYRALLASYIAKFILNYRTYPGAPPIYAVNFQNEPTVASLWPGGDYTSANEANFLGYLSRSLAAAKLIPKVFVMEDDWSRTAPGGYAATVLSSSNAALVSGVSMHCYSGVNGLSGLSWFAGRFPNAGLYVTECSMGLNSAPSPFDMIVAAGQNGTRAFMTWNLALDPLGGPKVNLNGCTNCTGVVTIDPVTKTYTLNREMHELSHASSHWAPGAVRVEATPKILLATGAITSLAFKNTDGTKVLLVHNNSTSNSSISVTDGTNSFNADMVANEMATYVWQ